MNPFVIAFIALYAVALCAYFFTRVGNKMAHRAANKMVMATMYLVYAIVMFHVGKFDGIYYVLLAALFLAYLGDLFLIFDFGRGGDFFLAGNICFSTFYFASLAERSVPFASYFWALIVWAVIVCAFVVLFVKLPNVFKLGKMRGAMLFYLASITLHGVMGLTAIIYIGDLSYLLMGAGSLLFMASDYILTVDRFVVKGTKWIVRCNSLTYFSGLLLIALSLGIHLVLV